MIQGISARRRQGAPRGLLARQWLERDSGLILPKREIVRCPAILHDWIEEEVPLEAGIGTPSSFGTGDDNLTGGASFTLTTSSAITAGNLALAFIGIDNEGDHVTHTVASANDGTNTYSKATSVVLVRTNNNYDLEVWYKANAAAVGSGATVTITYNSAGTNNSVAAMAQVSGIALLSPFDSAGSNTNTDGGSPSSSPTVTSNALSVASSIVFGVNLNSNSFDTYTHPAGWTNLFNQADPASGGDGICVDYKIVSATTAQTHNPTIAGTVDWLEIAAIFKGVALPAAPLRRIVRRYN